MKFDCGETEQEKKKRLEEWHDFFCLLPRKVADHDCRWLETIERSGYYSLVRDGWIWYYRAKK